MHKFIFIHFLEFMQANMRGKMIVNSRKKEGVLKNKRPNKDIKRTARSFQRKKLLSSLLKKVSR